MSNIHIHYTTEVIHGEPGPNMFWVGSSDNFRSLVNQIYPLARGEKETLVIETGTSFTLHGMDSVHLVQHTSYKDRFIVKNPHSIVVTLDVHHWRNIVHLITSITFAPSENFIEFDGEDLREDVNWIIKSSD